MNEKIGKFDWMFPYVFSKKTNGTYLILSQERWRNPDMPEFGIHGYDPPGNEEEIIELTPEMVVEAPGNGFPEAGWLQSFYRALSRAFKGKGNPEYVDPKMEACRREIERYAKEVETGFRKTGEWSMGKRIDRQPQTPQKFGPKDRITYIEKGEAGEFFLGKRITKHGQAAREKRMLHQNLGYTDRDLEEAGKLFAGCPKYLVTEQVMCIRGMTPEKAMRILPYLDAPFSRKELEGIYAGIPENKKGTIESIRALNSERYATYLEDLRKPYRSREGKFIASPGTPSQRSASSPGL